MIISNHIKKFDMANNHYKMTNNGYHPYKII